MSSLQCPSGVLSDHDYRRLTHWNKEFWCLCLTTQYIVCLSLCNFKCNLSHISHRKYALRATMLCVIEEEFGLRGTRKRDTGRHCTVRGACDPYCWGCQSKNVHAGFWSGRPEEKGPLRRPILRWDNNIKTVVQEIEWAPGLD